MALYDHLDDKAVSVDEFTIRKEAKVVITTSRNPSSELIKFAKTLSMLIPSSQRLNRGRMLKEELLEFLWISLFNNIFIRNSTTEDKLIN